MKKIFSEKYKDREKKISHFIDNFKNEGKPLVEDGRNQIRIFDLEGQKLNIKSFKIPNAVNKIVYRFFRKSKAERSFYYARHLLDIGIGTPAPIAYAEETTAFTFRRSFYVSDHLEADLTFRDLVNNPDYPQHEEILRAFARFTFELHEKKIEFLDHSAGNTLIRLNNGDYKFYLVDLNRMNFKELNFIERMENFARLTPKKEMVKIMANEYAKLIDKTESEVFEKMWYFTNLFQEKFKRKQELKKKLKF